MPQLKTKRIGKYKITKYPKAIWVRSLPFGENVKRFKTWKKAESYAKKKMKKVM